ncbi:ROK family protein [Couchioplanes caeruleus]|uniref:ROK family protein n=1 Tax=Couchioplanes caeruleus TaxID=56438 RepID=UPI0020C02559|nr:ROK family protein [Couchioplanes caeruleus]UQU65821.1 ROK family protein [Couchioplanes caeruleus]
MSVSFSSGRQRLVVPEASTVTSLRHRNRSLVLRHIILARETTRAKLGQACDLSPASVTKIVGEMIADGLVQENGSVSSRGGRPIALIGPRPEAAYSIGADIGERGVAVELFDLTMNRVDREFRGGREEESAETIAHDLSDALDALRDRNPEAWTRLLGVGLGLPGLVETDAAGEQILYAQTLGWPPVPVDRLISTTLPVFADNGAKTQAKAELWFGAAQEVDHCLVALLGRGVGLGMISDGRMTHGYAGSAAEWGHTKIQRGGRRCRCGGHGCVEAYAGSDAILTAWQREGGTFDGTGWRAIGAFLEAAETDAVAARLRDEVIDVIGIGLANMVNLVNPQRIIVGGWVGLRLMERLGERLEAAIRAHSLVRPGAQFDLRPSTFGGDAVALGAAIMPVEAMIAADTATG